MMFLHCFALTCKLIWDFHHNSSFLQRLPSGYRSCCNKKLMSVCMLNQNSRGTSSGFTNIKSNWNMSRSDWKCSLVHKYWLNQSKWNFQREYQTGCIMFFPKWSNGLSSSGKWPGHLTLCSWLTGSGSTCVNPPQPHHHVDNGEDQRSADKDQKIPANESMFR